MTPRKLPLELSPAEFRERIRMICGANREAFAGAPHAHPSLVRKPTDMGFYPPERKEPKQ
jgi:hypothetical protein